MHLGSGQLTLLDLGNDLRQYHDPCVIVYEEATHGQDNRIEVLLSEGRMFERARLRIPTSGTSRQPTDTGQHHAHRREFG